MTKSGFLANPTTGVLEACPFHTRPLTVLLEVAVDSPICKHCQMLFALNRFTLNGLSEMVWWWGDVCLQGFKSDSL